MTSSLPVELFRSNCDRTFVQYFLAQLDMVVFIKMALTLSIRFRSRSFIRKLCFKGIEYDFVHHMLGVLKTFVVSAVH